MLFLSLLLTSFVSVSWIAHESQFLAFSHGANPAGSCDFSPGGAGSWDHAGLRGGPGLGRSHGSTVAQLESSSE